MDPAGFAASAGWAGYGLQIDCWKREGSNEGERAWLHVGIEDHGDWAGRDEGFRGFCCV